MRSAAAENIKTTDHFTAEEMDSLHILPLSILPLATVSLKPARLIKNLHFQSVVEIYKDANSRSGQIAPER